MYVHMSTYAKLRPFFTWSTCQGWSHPNHLSIQYWSIIAYYIMGMMFENAHCSKKLRKIVKNWEWFCLYHWYHKSLKKNQHFLFKHIVCDFLKLQLFWISEHSGMHTHKKKELTAAAAAHCTDHQFVHSTS